MKLRATHSGWAFLAWLIWWWTICLVLDGPTSLAVYALLLLITFPRWWVDWSPKDFQHHAKIHGREIDFSTFGRFQLWRIHIGFSLSHRLSEATFRYIERKEVKFVEEEYD